MKYVIEIGDRPSLPVEGTDARFPVGRIYCVGRNYADHAREMGANPEREEPFFFAKPADAVVADPGKRGVVGPFFASTVCLPRAGGGPIF